MKRKLIILQDGYKECGSAALLSIIRYYEGNIPISKLIELTRTTKLGTNFYNIKEAALSLGLNSKSYKVDNLDKLIQLECPILCQLVNNNYTHFVVLYKIDKDKLIVMDPAKGKVILNKDTFLKMWTGYIMIFDPIRKLPNIISNKYLNKLLIEIILNNKKHILNIIFLSIIFTITACIYTFYLQIIIDKVINTNITNLVIISFIFGFILVIKNITSYLRNYLLIYLNQKIDCSLILNTFTKILSLPYSYYKNKTTGEMISRINDLTIIKNMLNKIIVTVLLDLFISLVGGLLLYSINRSLFFLLIIIILVFIVIFKIFNPLIKKMTNINQENNAKINSFLVESIYGFETIKGLRIEENISKKMEHIFVNSLNDSLILDKISNQELFLKEIITSLGLLLITFLGIKNVMNSTMSLGDLITFTSLLIYFIDPIRNIIDLNKEYHYVNNALKRANNLFEIKEEDSNNDYLLTNGNIIIKDLNYSYNNKKNVLTNVNIQIEDKEKVLILGNSGSGKSTLLKILYKYYDIKRNNIYINNNDLMDYNLSSIRKQICYVSQNEIIFTDTIRNNIILDRKINYEEFLGICKLTYVDEIVSNNLFGYDTLLEENGINISGGQRQRIILARALLKKSNIILIDEGLNELDINLERKILKNIFLYFSNKTIIIVSHRVDNIDLYKKVIKFQDGQVIDIIKRKNYG